MPIFLTLVGVLSAGLTASTAPHWWSAIFLLVSLILGGADGSASYNQNSSSRLNLTLDSVLNRISEVLWAIAFYRLGGLAAWVFAFAALAAFQEYAKARLAASEMQNVHLVTLADRSVRAIFLFIAIFVYQLTSSPTWVTSLAIGLTVVQAISFLLLIRFAYKELH